MIHKKAKYFLSVLLLLGGIASANATALSLADSFFSVAINGADFVNETGNSDVLLSSSNDFLNDGYFSVPNSVLVEDVFLGFAVSDFDGNSGSNSASSEANQVDDIFASSFQQLDLVFSVISAGAVSLFVDYAISASASTDNIGEAVNAFSSIDAVVRDSFLNDISSITSDQVNVDAFDGLNAFDDSLNSFEFIFPHLSVGDYSLQLTSSVLGFSTVVDAPAVVSSPQTLFLMGLGMLSMLLGNRKLSLQFFTHK